MRTENLKSQPKESKYLKPVLVVLGFMAASASAVVAWPALTHIGEKLI